MKIKNKLHINLKLYNETEQIILDKGSRKLRRVYDFLQKADFSKGQLTVIYDRGFFNSANFVSSAQANRILKSFSEKALLNFMGEGEDAN